MKTFIIILLSPFLLFSQTQIGNDINGEAAGDYFGESVSLSDNGSILAVGAYNNDGIGEDTGHVRVFEKVNGSWLQIGNDIDGEVSGADFGISTSLSSDGSILAVGAPGFGILDPDYKGKVKIYENNNGSWTQLGNEIEGEAPGDNFGIDVSLSSDGVKLAVGAFRNDGNGYRAGHVQVFENINTVWTQIGNDIDGEAEDDESGWSISLSSNGNIVVIGANRNDGNGNVAGHARVYENVNTIWTQIGNDIDGEASGDYSASDLSLSSNGNVVAIGATSNDGNGNSAGHVRVYENNNGTWAQIGSDIDGEAVADLSGYGVSLSANGTIVAISAPGNDGNGTSSGHVRVYKNSNDTWVQIGNDINGENAYDFSRRVALSADGSTVVMGAYSNDDSGTDSGQVRVYDISALLSNKSFELLGVSMYPNPAQNHFTIQLPERFQLKEVNIYNYLGQIIQQDFSTIINTQNLTKGTYLVEVVTNNGKATKKIIVE